MKFQLVVPFVAMMIGPASGAPTASECYLAIERYVDAMIILIAGSAENLPNPNITTDENAYAGIPYSDKVKIAESLQCIAEANGTQIETLSFRGRFTNHLLAKWAAGQLSVE